MAAISPNFSAAECKVWHYQDLSNAVQKKGQAFATSDLTSKEEYLAQGIAIAENLARSKRLDFVSVFMTRPQDGQVREQHNLLTSAAQINFNPGNTPLNNGQRLSAKALEDPSSAEFKHNMLGFGRLDFDAQQLNKIAMSNSGKVDPACE